MDTTAASSSARVLTGPQPSASTRHAIAASTLGALPQPLLRRVLRSARERTFPVGAIRGTYANGVEGPPLGLIVAGRIRYSLLSPNGRRLAFDYAGAGSLVGVAALAYADDAPHRPPAFDRNSFVPMTIVEVTRPVRMLELSSRDVLESAQHEPAFAWALAKQIARQAATSQALVTTNVFTPIRSRVARHLLNLAVREGREHVVTVSQQEIADTIGSVREVVARTVGGFIAEGTLAREGKRLVVLDAPRLSQLAQG